MRAFRWSRLSSSTRANAPWRVEMKEAADDDALVGGEEGAALAKRSQVLVAEAHHELQRGRIFREHTAHAERLRKRNKVWVVQLGAHDAVVELLLLRAEHLPREPTLRSCGR